MSPSARRLSRSWVLVGALACVAVAAVLLRMFVVAPYYIPSQSMEPTLYGCPGCHDDHILVDKLSYRLHAPHVGDVVVFDRPAAFDAPEAVLIKRVVAVGGARVQLHDGAVLVDGTPLREPYLNPACGPDPSSPETGRSRWTVPADEVFVMGDNRCDSADSRTFGPIAVSSVIGRAALIVYPVRRFGRL